MAKKINYTENQFVGNLGYYYMKELPSGRNEQRRAVFGFEINGNTYNRVMEIGNVIKDRVRIPTRTLEFRNHLPGIFLSQHNKPIFVDLDTWHQYKNCLIHTTPAGYPKIHYQGKAFMLYRLIVRLTDPDLEVDHFDRNPFNNKRSNLRVVTPAVNKSNLSMTSLNTSGFKGVSYASRSHRWRARISVNNVEKHLGTFDTPEEASDAYKAASRKLHPLSYDHVEK